ncbi:MAG TPA: thiamine-phosphate kinase [Candidatus Dormibacteraeota bacterium]|nr:thiamine-phosphate kinase [Candidatus Dormibacteraeota bacterium]
MTLEIAQPPERAFDGGGASLADVGEQALLRALQEIAAGSSPALAVGSGDDAAVWSPEPGRDLAISQDALVEGVDFRRSWISPRRLGARALAVALSDLAGMGARPVWCSATLCAPESTCFEDVLEIQRGLCAAAAAAGCAVAGGDVSAIDGPLVIDVSVGGTLAAGAVLRRDGGRPGDLVLVTGTLGRAAAGLRLLLDGGDELSEQERAWVDAELAPIARIGEGLQLVASGVRCGGDISDGLLVELERITEMSGCGAEIWLDRLPVEPALVSDFGAAWPDLAVGGGEDFELVAALPEAALGELLKIWPDELAPLTVVGRLRVGAGLDVLDREGGTPVPRPHTSSRHFA